MILESKDISEMPKRTRAAFVNSLSGFKGLNLLGTATSDGQTNLSVVSSVVHLGSNPALLGMVMRPPSVPRHSYENIKETGVYTLNHVSSEIVEQAHQTSARYEREVSEFDATGLTPLFSENFDAPAVKESAISIGLSLKEDMEIALNGCRFMIGEVQWVRFPEEALLKDGYLDLQQAGTITVAGLDGYHAAEKLFRLSYAKPHQPVRKLS